MNKAALGGGRHHRELLITVGLPVLLALAGGVAIAFWVHGSAPPADIVARTGVASTAEAPTPASTGASPAAASTGQTPAPPAPAAAGGTTVASGATASNVPGFWPWFRGPNRDDISPENVKLARSWPAGGPKVLWSLNLGEGYAGPAIRNGKVYLLDWANGQDVLRCLSFADGKDIWKYSYPDPIKRNHGMSRTVPAVTDKYVVSFGSSDMVTCADANSGKMIWQKDLVQQYGAKVPEWYAGQCPLIEGDKVILAPAGRVMMLATDLASGKVLWEAPNSTGWKQSHASLCAADIGGKHQYIYVADGGVVSVDAGSGQMLWKTGEWRVSTATIPTALSLGDGRVFFTGGYNAGSLMVKVADNAVQTLYRLDAQTFSSKQQTPLLQNGYIYGVLENGELVCINLDGKVQWRSGSTERFGLGPFVMAPGGLMYLLNDTGKLTLAQVSPTGFSPLASASLFSNGQDAWGPLALTAGKLIARDLTRMVCLEVGG